MSIQERSTGRHRDGGPGTVPARTRRRRWPLIAILVAALALPVGAFVVTRVHLGGSGGLPDALRTDLGRQVETILETSPVIANVGLPLHDHDQAAPTQVLCAVDPFGVDPTTARTVDQVRTVYAQHLCVIAPPGTPWDYAVKSAGPVAVGLDTATVRLPQPKRDYRTQVREMIPARYLDQAFGTFAHPELVAQLRTRFLALASATP